MPITWAPSPWRCARKARRGDVAAEVGDLVAVGLQVGDDDGLADVVHVALHGAEDDAPLGLGGLALEGGVGDLGGARHGVGAHHQLGQEELAALEELADLLDAFDEAVGHDVRGGDARGEGARWRSPRRPRGRHWRSMRPAGTASVVDVGAPAHQRPWPVDACRHWRCTVGAQLVGPVLGHGGPPTITLTESRRPAPEGGDGLAHARQGGGEQGAHAEDRRGSARVTAATKRAARDPGAEVDDLEAGALKEHGRRGSCRCRGGRPRRCR